MPFKVELGIELCRIIGPNGEEGPECTFDAPAIIKIGEHIYICDVKFNAEGEATHDQEVERIGSCFPEPTISEDVEDEDILGPDDDEDGGDGGEELDEHSPGPELVA